MADQNYEIGLKVTSQSDDSAVRQTETSLKKLHDEGQRGGAIWDGLGKKVLGFIAAFVGFQKIAGWLKDAFAKAVEAESSLLRLGNTMLAFDPQTKRTAESVGEWAKALAKLTGVSDELTQGIVMRFLPVLKNTEAAMHLAAVAALAQKRGWTDAASAADLFGNAIMGKPVKGTDMLSRLLYESHLKGEDFAITLEKIEMALATTTTAIESAALKLARMKEQQEETKEAVGATFLKLLDALQPLIRGFSLFIGMVVTGFAAIVESTKLVVKDVYAAGVFVVNIPFGLMKAHKAYTQALSDNSAAMAKNMGEYEEMLANILEAFSRDTTAIDALSAKADAEAKKRIAETYARLKAEREREARERKAQEEKERLAKAAVDAAEAGIKYRQAVQDAKTAATAHLHVEQDLNAKTLAALRLHEGRVLQIKQLANANIKKMDAQQLAIHIAMLKEVLGAEIANAEDRIQLTLAMAQTEQEIKQRGLIAVGIAATRAGEQLFANNKAMAVALAIVDAFLAAAGAAAETHGDVYTRIAAYIAAFAQVWAAVTAIQGTEIGSTGGGGAGGAGASPPAPMVYTGTSRAAAPPTSTSTTNVTTNAPATTVVNVNALDTTNALRSAQRALRPAGRAYDRTLVGRGSVIVGTRRPR